MQYGIQRRNIYLVPPNAKDLAYMLDSFDQTEVWEMFGFEGPSKKMMKMRHKKGNLLIGIIYRVDDRKRLGFAICYPPPVSLFDSGWEFGVVILDPKDRDAWCAIAAGDAMAHYLLDHLRVEHAMWRIRTDNRASNAIARRMGYRPAGRWSVGDHKFDFYRMNQDIWRKRRERLDRQEEKHPSGIGATFLTLMDAPYEPEVPTFPSS